MSLRQYLEGIVAEDKIEKLETVQQFYLEKLPTFNFTAHRTVEDFEILNMLDSVKPFIHQEDSMKNISTILDIGTGGGFPGVPLAVLYPEIEFTLCDSVGKKMHLIEQIVDKYNLQNITIRPGRFEELGREKTLRESFDMVLSRAVAKWPTLLEYALPFVKKDGVFLAYQGEAVLGELKSSHTIISALGGKYSETTTYSLPQNKGERYIVSIIKETSTPSLYPRATGIPKKTPLSL